MASYEAAPGAEPFLLCTAWGTALTSSKCLGCCWLPCNPICLGCPTPVAFGFYFKRTQASPAGLAAPWHKRTQPRKSQWLLKEVLGTNPE